MESNITESPNFKTMILVCKDCGCDWLLTDQEQLSFYRKKLAMPKRCPECRQQRKTQGLSTTITNSDGGLK
jgi:hypothetical protein